MNDRLKKDIVKQTGFLKILDIVLQKNNLWDILAGVEAVL